MPRIWGEDHLLPRMPDGRGFMAGVLAPGGCIYKIDPDGKNWELISIGYRNPYDIAFNRDGDLFTYDADMEWDINTPWYRPTRVCHVASGSDFGWRNGAGKWPAYYPDSLPAVVDIGPGSPTGITFGYGAKFPAKYQEALFICDWSYGKLYAVHLRARRGSLHGHGRGVHHRHPAAPDRHGDQPARRRDVLRHRRPADPVGPLPRDLRRRRIDRADAADGPPIEVAREDPRDARSVPRRRDPAADRRGLAVPRPPRPLPPLRRPGGASSTRTPSTGASGPWPRTTRRPR